jgi:hypothetical protein
MCLGVDIVNTQQLSTSAQWKKDMARLFQALRIGSQPRNGSVD